MLWRSVQVWGLPTLLYINNKSPTLIALLLIQGWLGELHIHGLLPMPRWKLCQPRCWNGYFRMYNRVLPDSAWAGKEKASSHDWWQYQWKSSWSWCEAQVGAAAWRCPRLRWGQETVRESVPQEQWWRGSAADDQRLEQDRSAWSCRWAAPRLVDSRPYHPAGVTSSRPKPPRRLPQGLFDAAMVAEPLTLAELPLIPLERSEIRI